MSPEPVVSDRDREIAQAYYTDMRYTEDEGERVEYLAGLMAAHRAEGDAAGYRKGIEDAAKAMRSVATNLARAGLLLARSNQAADAPASSISAELAIRTASGIAENYLSQPAKGDGK
jgi:hypothetical protein